MLIKKIKLKNIRSYMEEEIKFPENITLLSGDIGSGKSTILLAIDFALFGIRRGELSGSALLRNGSNEGYVILNFEIDNKEISVKRTLKRTNNSIVQDSGYLTINDITKELTPVELKQKILDLLNYPPEMLTRKSLIYRYTVYTPQEEMKLILLGEKEDRLQTLRKVFNIDKYKRIKDNSKIILAEVKQKKKENLGIIYDLDDKKSRLKEKEQEINNLNKNIETAKLRLETLKLSKDKKQQEISDFEQQILKINSLKKDIEIFSHKFNSAEEQKFKNHTQIKLIERQLLESDIKIEINYDELKLNIENNEKFLEETERKLKEITKNIIEINSKKRNSMETSSSIMKLDFCPLCKQSVSEEHKHAVLKREEELLLKLEDNINIFITRENQLNSKIKEIKQLIGNYKNLEKEYEIHKVKQKDINYKKELINNIKKEQEQIEIILKEIVNKKQKIEEDLGKLKDTGREYEINKKELNELLAQERKIEINIASISKEHETIQKELLYIKKEILEKEKAKEKLDYYIKLQDWLENFFTGIMDIMEKKVMLRVYIDFNSLFQKWFDMLIDNDLIKVKLDEEFTPLIEQNNHDIEYENLSGGEKTSCALAYRLALNQVINNVVTSINTKDIIILDEPTDGFSLEQLDKIKYVLEELKMKQIIIVSHESKIESFVDNIIKIKKEGHISRIN